MESVWSDSVSKIRDTRPPLCGDLETDVLVVGGGMAGILTAHRLSEYGIGSTVVEAETVGSGATGNTTAKITAQHGLIYADIMKRYGREKARLYLNANTHAIAEFRALAKKYPCDFEEKAAFVYSTGRLDRLEREAVAYQRLGLPADIVDTPSIPVKTVGALGMEGQAQFNPLKLLVALSDDLDIYENTPVRDVVDGVAVTDRGRIRAEHIILCTHFPLVNIPGLYFMKLYQHRSYVIAMEGAPAPDGMFVDEKEEGYSFRSYQDFVLAGGGDHRTGKNGGGIEQLRGFVRTAWPSATPRYHWAAQDCMSLDLIPYIGRHSAGAGNLYVATGFGKWGMTGSMVASRIICELIASGKSELAELYSPQRPILTHKLVNNLLSSMAGFLQIGSPRCTHMGCKLHKNAAEGTWDCACHGSRFDRNGRVIENPAKRGLKI